MKTKYKHIHFEQWEDTRWHCKNNKTNSTLGYVDYYVSWKCFVFEGKAGCCFDVKCLSDIIDFMGQLNAR